jgi:hypothetical protein
MVDGLIRRPRRLINGVMYNMGGRWAGEWMVEGKERRGRKEEKQEEGNQEERWKLLIDEYSFGGSYSFEQSLVGSPK